MDKWISYDKLSKKDKRKCDQAKRQTWGVISPNWNLWKKPAFFVRISCAIGEEMI